MQCACNQSQTLIWYNLVYRRQEYKISHCRKRKNIHKHRTSHLGEARTKAEAAVASWHRGSEHSERPKAELLQSCCNFFVDYFSCQRWPQHRHISETHLCLEIPFIQYGLPTLLNIDMTDQKMFGKVFVCLETLIHSNYKPNWLISEKQNHPIRYTWI